MNISGIATVVVIGVSVFLGMYSVMFDLNMAGYNIDLPEGSEDSANQLFEDMNKTASDIENTLTGEESWLQTAYNIFFTLPSDAVNTLSVIANSAGKLLGIAAGEDMQSVPIPPWVTTMILTMIGLSIAFTLIYIVMGRRV